MYIYTYRAEGGQAGSPRALPRASKPTLAPAVSATPPVLPLTPFP